MYLMSKFGKNLNKFVIYLQMLKFKMATEIISHVHLFILIETADFYWGFFSMFTDMDYNAKMYPCYYNPTQWLVAMTREE